MYVCVYVCMYACMYVCMYLCIYMYVCVCVCVCVYAGDVGNDDDMPEAACSPEFDALDARMQDKFMDLLAEKHVDAVVVEALVRMSCIYIIHTQTHAHTPYVACGWTCCCSGFGALYCGARAVV